MNNTFKKTIEGHLVLTVRVPFSFGVDAHDEIYEDKYGNKYVEEEYEYGIVDALKYNPNDTAKAINNDIKMLEQHGWNVEEIEFEEC